MLLKCGIALKRFKGVAEIVAFTFKKAIKPEEKLKGTEAHYTEMFHHLYYADAIVYVDEVIKPLT